MISIIGVAPKGTQVHGAELINLWSQEWKWSEGLGTGQSPEAGK